MNFLALLQGWMKNIFKSIFDLITLKPLLGNGNASQKSSNSNNVYVNVPSEEIIVGNVNNFSTKAKSRDEIEKEDEAKLKKEEESENVAKEFNTYQFYKLPSKNIEIDPSLL